MKIKFKIKLITVFLAVGLMSSMLFLTNNVSDTSGSFEEILSIANFEDVSIEENGNAHVSLIIDVADSALAEMYREMLATPTDAALDEEILIPENRTENGIVLPVRQEFHYSIKKEQKSSMGFAMRILNSSVIPQTDQGNLKVSIDAYMTPQITVTPNGSDGIWEIFVGPKNDQSLGVVAGDVITKTSFAQQLLGSLDGDQVYDASKTIRISLPCGAEVLNMDELEGLNWNVDFGGGSFMTASVSVDEDSNIVLNERTFITEQNFTATTNEVFEAIREYKIFTINYFLKDHSAISGENVWVSNDGDWAKSWDTDWSQQFKIPIKGEWNGVGIDAELVVTPSFEFSGYIGFDFSWHRHGIIPLYEPDWFKATIGAEAKLNTKFSGKIYGSFERRLEKSIFDQTLLEWSFPIDGVVVDAQLDLSLIASIKLKGSVQLEFEMESNAKLSFEAGLKWDHDDGWSTIKSGAANADLKGPDLNFRMNAEVEPSLRLRVAFLLYGEAGPFIEIQPYFNGKVTWYVNADDDFADWSTRVGWRLNVGLVLKGSIANLLGINYPYVRTLFEQVLWEKQGRLGKAPSEISVKVEPDLTYIGGGFTVSGAITSDYPGSKRGKVYIEHSTNGLIWDGLFGNAFSYDGEYSTRIIAQSVEDYFVRARWEGNDIFKEATSSIKLLNVSSEVTGSQEIAYDTGDGILQGYTGRIGADQADAVRFTTSHSSPTWVLQEIKFYGADQGYLHPDPEIPISNNIYQRDPNAYFYVEVWDQDRNELYRGSYRCGDIFSYSLESALTSGVSGLVKIPYEHYVCSTDWYTIDIPDITVTGDFYIAIGHPMVSPTLLQPQGIKFGYTPPLETGFTNRSHLVYLGNNSDNTEYTAFITNWQGELMIRAVGVPVVQSNVISKYDQSQWGYPIVETDTFYTYDWVLMWNVKVRMDGGGHRIEHKIADGITGEELFHYTGATNDGYTSSDWKGNYYLEMQIQSAPELWEPHLGEPLALQLWIDDKMVATKSFWIGKYESPITAHSSTTNPIFGQQITITGTALTSEGYVSLSYSTDNITWTPIGSASIQSTSYQVDWTPPFAGNFTVRVIWDGNEYYEGSTEILNFNVPTRSTNLSILANGNSNDFDVTYGSTIRLAGNFNPYPAFPINVTFQYSYDYYTPEGMGPYQSNWYVLGCAEPSVYIPYPNGGIGSAVLNWEPLERGTYYVRAIWLGDRGYTASESSTIKIRVLTSNRTSTEIIAGANALVNRNPDANVIFGVKVKDLTTDEYLKTVGDVTFYVTDEAHKNFVFAGSDNDTDGDGVYQIQWTADDDWASLGTQYWTAEFTGTQDYMPSSASTSFTITYNGAEMWLDSTSKTVKIGGTTQYKLTFKWNQDNQETFDLSISGLDSSWYTLSKTSINVNSIGQTEEVILSISPPEETTELRDYNFSITATNRKNSNFAFSIGATVKTYFTPVATSVSSGGLAIAVNPKTAVALISDAGSPTEITIHLENNQNFDDTVTVETTVFGIPSEYQAQMQWFSWNSKDIFVPAGAEVDIPLTINIWPFSEVAPKTILPDINGFIFKIEATSNADLSTIAIDSAIIQTFMSVG